MLVAEGTNYSLLLFTVGLMYVLLSILRRSAASAAAAVIAGNGALWTLLHDHGYALWQQPQFWLIPPAVSVLIAGQLNRHRLSDEQLTALRYASMLVIYVSSTSEMFLRGIGSSLWPPMVLASLSVGASCWGSRCESGRFCIWVPVSSCCRSSAWSGTRRKPSSIPGPGGPLASDWE
jgi:hypothetical protein